MRYAGEEAGDGSPLRIVHVVSGLAPDGRFGGITRVALDLAGEQRRRGHRVHIVSSDIGFSRPAPRTIGGTPVTLLRSAHPFPSLGFGTIVSPALPLVMLRLLRRADLVHVHLAREPNTLIAAIISRWSGTACVAQTHGMLDAAGGAIARVVDQILTSRALRGVSAALTLTSEEDAEVVRLSRGALIGSRFPNGVGPAPAEGPRGRRDRVLFLARLHPRKGAARFTEAAVRVAPGAPHLRFDIVGPDEGDAQRVRAAVDQGQTGRIEYLGPVPHARVPELMAESVLYCLPAEDEPFGLSVLEALAASTPVLLHATAQLAPDVVAAEAGWSFGRDGADDLTATLRRVLADPEELRRRGERGRLLVERSYGIERIAARLDEVYLSVLRNRH